MQREAAQGKVIGGGVAAVGDAESLADRPACIIDGLPGAVRNIRLTCISLPTLHTRSSICKLPGPSDISYRAATTHNTYTMIGQATGMLGEGEIASEEPLCQELTKMQMAFTSI